MIQESSRSAWRKLGGLFLVLAIGVSACGLPAPLPSTSQTAEALDSETQRTEMTPSSTAVEMAAAQRLSGEIVVNRVRVTEGSITFGGRSTLPAGTCLQTQLFSGGVPVDWWPIDDCVRVQNGEWVITVPLGQDGAPTTLDATTDYTLRAWAFDDPNIQSEIFWLELTGPPAPPTPTLPPPPTITPAVSVPSTPADPRVAALLPPLPVTPPPADWVPTQLPPFDPATDTPEAWTQDYVALVTALLNTTGDVDATLDQLIAWMPGDSYFEGTRPPNAWAAMLDLDADATPEWLMSVPARDRSCGATFCPGHILIFKETDGLFVPLHIIVAGADMWEFSNPALMLVEDINADGALELVLRHESCGAHTCFSSLIIGRWDGTRWHDLVADPIELSYAEITIADRDGDGAKEIALQGGTFGSVGAGLQRAHTLVFAWRDGAYRLVEDIPDPSDHPYYRILDANTALANGDPDRALALVLGVLAMDAPPEDAYVPIEEETWSRLFAYATIEAMLVYAQWGDLAGMEDVYFDMTEQPVFVPYNPYEGGALRLLETYRETGDALAACQAMEAVIAEQAEAAPFFEWYGYGTERMTLDQLCPLDPPAADGERMEL